MKKLQNSRAGQKWPIRVFYIIKHEKCSKKKIYSTISIEIINIFTNIFNMFFEYKFQALFTLHSSFTVLFPSTWFTTSSSSFHWFFGYGLIIMFDSFQLTSFLTLNKEFLLILEIIRVELEMQFESIMFSQVDNVLENSKQLSISSSFGAVIANFLAQYICFHLHQVVVGYNFKL